LWSWGLRTDTGRSHGVAGCSFGLYAESGFYYAIPLISVYDTTKVQSSADTTGNRHCYGNLLMMLSRHRQLISHWGLVVNWGVICLGNGPLNLRQSLCCACLAIPFSSAASTTRECSKKKHRVDHKLDSKSPITASQIVAFTP